MKWYILYFYLFSIGNYRITMKDEAIEIASFYKIKQNDSKIPSLPKFSLNLLKIK